MKILKVTLISIAMLSLGVGIGFAVKDRDLNLGAYNPINANGQATMANSAPIVIASNQSSIPIAGDIASAATDSGNPLKIGGVNRTTKPTFTDGQRGDLQMDTRGMLGVALYGANLGAPIIVLADNADGVAASATVNKLGLMSRNTLLNGSNWDRAQVVTNATNSTGTGIAAVGILAQLDDTSPTAITENSFGNIRISADRSILVTNRATTPTQTSVAGSATSVSLLAANASRKGATVYNDSSAILYLKLGATASTTSYTLQMAANGYYEVPFGYVGAIDGIWASATGNARITELN